MQGAAVVRQARAASERADEEGAHKSTTKRLLKPEASKQSPVFHFACHIHGLVPVLLLLLTY